LRDDHERFSALNARVLAIAPEDMAAARKYLERNPLPYSVLPDPDHAVFDRYDVANKLMSLGQRPVLFVIDAGGIVRYNQVGVQQWQIPEDDEILALLGKLA
jgi:peroxiredoxin Q/BCP